MTIIELANMHSEMQDVTGELSRALLKAHEALHEINKYNNINNDLQAYLFWMAQWGLGEEKKRPNPKSYNF